MECPTITETWYTPGSRARTFSTAIQNLIARLKDGAHRVVASISKYATNPHWRDLVLFHEYLTAEKPAAAAARAIRTRSTAPRGKIMENTDEHTDRSEVRREREKRRMDKTTRKEVAHELRDEVVSIGL